MTFRQSPMLRQLPFITLGYYLRSLFSMLGLLNFGTIGCLVYLLVVYYKRLPFGCKFQVIAIVLWQLILFWSITSDIPTFQNATIIKCYLPIESFIYLLILNRGWTLLKKQRLCVSHILRSHDLVRSHLSWRLLWLLSEKLERQRLRNLGKTWGLQNLRGLSAIYLVMFTST